MKRARLGSFVSGSMNASSATRASAWSRSETSTTMPIAAGSPSQSVRVT